MLQLLDERFTIVTHTMNTPHVAYYRVSTVKQGQSGLGIEAQEAAVRSFLNGREPVQSFRETESGKHNARPILAKAIEAARACNGVLVIAKLDRLSRDAAFVLALRDSGVRFVCCDMPEANSLTIGLMAILAQHERETISQRTKAALQALKRRGRKLGTPANLTDEARAKSVRVRKANAKQDTNWTRAKGYAIVRRQQGATFRQIAAELNEQGHVTRRGQQYAATTVMRLCKS